MKLKRLGLAGVALFALAACSHPPNHGTVTSRKYSAAHYLDYVTYYCAGYNSKGVCTVTIPNWHHDYVGPNWQLCLRADGDDSNHDKTGCIDVPESTYDKYPAGTYYGG